MKVSFHRSSNQGDVPLHRAAGPPVLDSLRSAGLVFPPSYLPGGGEGLDVWLHVSPIWDKGLREKKGVSTSSEAWGPEKTERPALMESVRVNSDSL